MTDIAILRKFEPCPRQRFPHTIYKGKREPLNADSVPEIRLSRSNNREIVTKSRDFVTINSESEKTCCIFCPKFADYEKIPPRGLIFLTVDAIMVTNLLISRWTDVIFTP